MYHNTTNVQGQELRVYTLQAKNQDVAVLNVFQQIKQPLTPSDVLGFAFYSNTPITSIRRSFNTLTRKGLLMKTTDTRKGMYGKPEHCWRLV